MVDIEGGADTVYVESAAGGTVTDHSGDAAEIHTRYEELRAQALPTRASIDLMAKVMTKWTQT